MLDDLRKNIQQNQRWALKEWVEGAKLLVIAADVHCLKGDDYVQFACSHLPIEGKSPAAKARAAYDLYLLGYAEEGQSANGDLVIQECEAQAKLRPHNFEWPYWRTVTARLRTAAKEKEQGDGIPAGEDADQNLPEFGYQDDARRVRFLFYRACEAAAETPPAGIAQQAAEWWLSRAGCSPRFVMELWDIL